MKKALLTFCIVAVAGSVFAQSLNRSLLSRRRERSRLVSEPQLLEPLLPFAEAIEKAKANDPRGWYALAVHYSKGESVSLDLDRARKLMEKSASLNYSNAVFVVAMLLHANSATAEDCGGFGKISTTPRIGRYLNGSEFPVWRSRPTLSITNATDVSKIRKEYKRAFRLGVSAATNELARFERRVKAEQERIEEKRKRDEEKERNAKLADELLQNL